MAVRPEGANHQWRKIPPGELSIDPVAVDLFVELIHDLGRRIPGRAEAEIGA
jgi:hypothetical protein